MAKKTSTEDNDGQGAVKSSQKRHKESPFNRKKFDGGTPLEQMILGLSDEIDFADKNLKTQTLKNGQRINEMGGLHVYKFNLDRRFDFDPDEGLAVAINGNDYRGKVIQVELGHVLIGIEDDHGELLTKAVIAKAENVLEKLLRKQLVNVFDKAIPFNEELANLVIGEKYPTVIEKPLPEVVPAFLNAQSPKWSLAKDQEHLIRIAQESDCTILWGPPGCGKTRIIGMLATSYLADGKRILVVSNANKAVDGALDAILETHDTVSNSLELYDNDKTILRPGSDGITAEFKDKWGAVSLLDEVVKTRTIEIYAERDDLALEKSKIEPELGKIRSSLGVYEELESNFEISKQLPTQHQKSLNEAKKLEQGIVDQEVRIGTLEREYVDAPEQANFKTKIGFGRPREEVERELIDTRSQLKSSKESLEKKQGNVTALLREMKVIEVTLADLNQRASTLPLKAQLEAQQSTIEPRLSKISERIDAINKDLDEMADKILRSADVVGTTVHKSFLDPTLSSLEFDVVIVDEASMVVLPMTYWAAGRAKKQVVIVGDFKQLPAIVKNLDSELVASWLTETPFDKCGIREAVKESRSGKPLPDYLVALKVQNRMHNDISQLVSRQFYEGTLETAELVLKRPTAQRLTIQDTDNRLLLIDTKDLGAWSSQPFSGKGRFNPTHAALALSLIDKLIIDDQLSTDGKSPMERIGLITPYAGQADLFMKVTEKEHRSFIHESSIGTTHKFQGSERDIIIFDYVISEGLKYPDRFLISETGEDQPGNMLNVAISRAKEHLVIIYNSDDFNEKSTTEWMRQFLADYASRAEHIDARELLDESALLGKVRQISQGYSFSISQPNTLHDEHSFYGGVKDDLLNAIKSVVIFSAFATPNNLGRWLNIFQELLERGIKLRIVTKPISQQPKPKTLGPQLKSMFDLCRKAGIAVDMRTVTHEKAVLIDEEIVWHGSLNMLSQDQGRTTELMTRTVSEDFASQMLRLLSRHDLKQVDQSSRQLPACPTCSGPTSLNVSWNGKEHLFCENDCGFITGNWNFADLARGVPVGRHLEPCPECGGGIIKLEKSYKGLAGKCSNAFAKTPRKKCSYKTDITFRDLKPYDPYPPETAPDTSFLKDIMVDAKVEMPLSKIKIGNQDKPRETSSSKKKAGTPSRKTIAAELPPPKKKILRATNADELTDFLAGLN